MTGIPDDILSAQKVWRSVQEKYVGRQVRYVGSKKFEEDWPSPGDIGRIVKLEWESTGDLSPFVVSFENTPYYLQLGTGDIELL